MHINVIPNRGAAPTILLRESFRDGTKVCKRTLANLSALSAAQVQMIRGALRGDVLQAVEKTFEVIASPAHGHVQAVFLAMQRLGFASVLASKPSPERDLVLAMVASRIICPATKLATTRLWQCEHPGPGVWRERCRRGRVVRRHGLAARRPRPHSKETGSAPPQRRLLVLYDLSSSYFEGSCCPLAKLGYSRDGKRGTLQVNYGLLTDDRGCPVAISVYEGNTSDSTTFASGQAPARGIWH
jgi:hypothetical protein